MAVDVDERLERYADLAVRVGANVEEGQDVFIQALIEHAPLARAMTRAAYRAGAAGDVTYVARAAALAALARIDPAAARPLHGL